jgi:hypothetical protein
MGFISSLRIRRMETSRPYLIISRDYYNKRAWLNMYIYIYFLMTVIVSVRLLPFIIIIYIRLAINKSLGCLNINS